MKNVWVRLYEWSGEFFFLAIPLCFLSILVGEGMFVPGSGNTGYRFVSQGQGLGPAAYIDGSVTTKSTMLFISAIIISIGIVLFLISVISPRVRRRLTLAKLIYFFIGRPLFGFYVCVIVLIPGLLLSKVLPPLFYMVLVFVAALAFLTVRWIKLDDEYEVIIENKDNQPYDLVYRESLNCTSSLINREGTGKVHSTIEPNGIASRRFKYNMSVSVTGVGDFEVVSDEVYVINNGTISENGN